METTVRQRLESFIEFKKISKSEFGRTIGVSAAYITSMRKSIQPDKVKRIALSYPDLNINWLLTGNGQMLKDDKIVVPIPPPSASHDVEIYKKLVASLEETVASQKLIIQKLTDELKLINQRANIAVAVQTAKRARRRAANGRGAIAASAEPSDD